jgi:hypothetical protein
MITDFRFSDWQACLLVVNKALDTISFVTKAILSPVRIFLLA